MLTHISGRTTGYKLRTNLAKRAERCYRLSSGIGRERSFQFGYGMPAQGPAGWRAAGRSISSGSTRPYLQAAGREYEITRSVWCCTIRSLINLGNRALRE